MKILRITVLVILFIILFLLFNRKTEIIDKELGEDIFHDIRNQDTSELSF